MFNLTWPETSYSLPGSFSFFFPHFSSKSSVSQADRHTGRQTGRPADRQEDSQAETLTERHAARQTDRQSGKQTYRQTGSQAGRQVSRQADRQINRQAYRRHELKRVKDKGGRVILSCSVSARIKKTKKNFFGGGGRGGRQTKLTRVDGTEVSNNSRRVVE